MNSALHKENLTDAGEEVIVILKIKHQLRCESVDWVQLGQVQLQILGSKILCFWFPQNESNSFISFSKSHRIISERAEPVATSQI
jgi:hypothetical protein